MGMAASQAHLLTLTARLHDIEYKAQNIESRKIELATQKDELYQNYCDALDKKKIQVAFNAAGGGKTYVDACFASLCAYNEDRTTDYTLKDEKTGKILVTPEEYEAYCGYPGYKNDKYAFAWEMLGLDQYWKDGPLADNKDGNSIGIKPQDENEIRTMSECEQLAFDELWPNGSGLPGDIKSKKEILDKAINDGDDSSKIQKALKDFRQALYKNVDFQNTVFELMCRNKNTPETREGSIADKYDMDPSSGFPKGEFDHYVRLFESIQAAGGCIEMDMAYASGEEGNEWLNNMVSSGRVLINVYNKNKQCWTETSVATSTNANNLQQVSDETDLKKAEAEYEYELGVINRKDTKYDKELSKLETERTAITTEMDSIKKVRNENIERTFGIFS